MTPFSIDLPDIINNKRAMHVHLRLACSIIRLVKNLRPYDKTRNILYVYVWFNNLDYFVSLVCCLLLFIRNGAFRYMVFPKRTD